MARAVNPAVVRAVQQPTEARRGEVERGQAVRAQIFQVFGRVELQGAGEALFDAAFPVWFLDPPQLSFGGELGGNQALTAGQFPTVNIMVRSWQTTRRAGHVYYVGAQFIVVVTGPADMFVTAHWQCEGVGLTNPLVGQGGLDEAI